MFAPARDARTALERTVGALPEGFRALEGDRDRVVIGPTGAFVLTVPEPDLDTATSALSARHVAGDATLTGRLAEEARGRWRRRGGRWLVVLEGYTRCTDS